MQNITLDHLMAIMTERTKLEYGAIIKTSRLAVMQHTYRSNATVWVNDSDKANQEFRNYLIQQGFIYTNQGSAVSDYLLADTTNNCIGNYVTATNNGQTMKVAVFGELKKGLEIIDWLKDKHPETGSVIRTATSYTQQYDRVNFDTEFVRGDQINKAKQEFYPWMKAPLEDYFDAFMAAAESVLVLFGPPGGGKSTFIRTMIAHRNRHAMLAYNSEVIKQPALVRQYMEDSQETILAYEDIDRFLGKREDGNDLMSSLLNSSEGIIQKPGKKIIFSTNLSSIDKIDPALLRVGRCFDILKFENLTAEQAGVARLAAGRTPREFDSSKSYSLSEALAEAAAVQQTINRFANGVGFK